MSDFELYYMYYDTKGSRGGMYCNCYYYWVYYWLLTFIIFVRAKEVPSWSWNIY